MKNKAGLIHKQAEEKRAMVAAKKSKDNLKAEELAAKYRATGTVQRSSSHALKITDAGEKVNAAESLLVVSTEVNANSLKLMLISQTED
ncbi:remorin family protein [Tanacetum coccineum]